jgi:HAD superfamily hydrolase (TIGR01509 family)
MLKHILFDHDGTLVDSEVLAIDLMLKTLRPYGFQMSTDEYAQRFPGLLEYQILEIISKDYNIKFDQSVVIADLHSQFSSIFDTQLKAIPGITSLFRSLKIPKSVVSNASRPHIERCMKKVKLINALDGQFFSAYEVAKPKPEPDVYLHALKILQLSVNETVVVEDSPTGVLAAKAAGLRVIGFLGATHIKGNQLHAQKLVDCGADFLANNAKELGQHFNDLNGNRNLFR